MKITETIYYTRVNVDKKANAEFYRTMKEIRETYRWCEGEWQGDYYVTTYMSDDYRVMAKIWENEELGIPSKIEIGKPTDMEKYANSPSEN